ncbi:MAG: SOS response-associated peptidase family protein, partial [Thiohalospira sp.]
MCGRYDLHEPAPRIAEVLGAQLLLDGWEAHYNIPPGQTIPIARLDDSDSRMPVVLEPSSWAAWLSPELTERDTLREATSHLAPEALTQWPVSPRVNRPDADDAGLLEPLNGP